MPVKVRLLGGAQRAKAVLGRIPKNWTVQAFDAISVQTFLSELDFFVHYPHPNWIEAFARGPIEAMAAGIPIIVPPNMVELYGEGAVYAEPAEVFPIIQSLWRDKLAYAAQVKRGLDFVERTCALERFADRIAPYLGPRGEAPAAAPNRALGDARSHEQIHADQSGAAG